MIKKKCLRRPKVDKPAEISNTSTMIRSMTGYGTSQLVAESHTLDVQVKSVNSRYLEVKFRSPKIYQHLELEVKKIVQEFLDRGSVDVMIHRVQSGKADESKVSINLDLAKQWHEACKTLQNKLDLTDELFNRFMSQAQGLFQVQDSNQITENEEKTFLSCVKKAVLVCQADRLREGKVSQASLEKYLGELEKFQSSLKKSRGDISHKIREKLEKASREWAIPELDQGRLAQEIFYWVEKLDVAEEIDRLGGHIDFFYKCLKETKSVGKKMDFLTQELIREVNTIGSKVQDLEIGILTIEAKTSIERLREQVQNIQ